VIVREKLDKKVAERLLSEQAISENRPKMNGISTLSSRFCMSSAIKSKNSFLNLSDSSKFQEKSKKANFKTTSSYKNKVDASQGLCTSNSRLREKLSKLKKQNAGTIACAPWSSFIN
jgi:hypothetical protein